MDTLGKRIKFVRKELNNYTQAQFGEMIKVKPSTVTGYEKDDSIPQPSTIELICERFDINEHWLLTGEGPIHPVRERKEELTYLFGKAMKEGNANRMAFLSIGLRMTPEQVEQWAQMFLEVAAELQKEKKPES